MKLSNYLSETKAELKHVNWPTRKQAINYTAVVIVFSLAIAGALGAFDLVFNSILKLVL